MVGDHGCPAGQRLQTTPRQGVGVAQSQVSSTALQHTEHVQVSQASEHVDPVVVDVVGKLCEASHQMGELAGWLL